MITYPDGTEAKSGDHVLLAHGVHQGVVHDVIQTLEEQHSWNLDLPGLMIESTCCGLVFWPTQALVEDEIAFCSRKAD